MSNTSSGLTPYTAAYALAAALMNFSMEVEPRTTILPPSGRLACFSKLTTGIASAPALARLAGSDR